MADNLEKADPGVWIELGGEKRKIVFSMHSLRQIKKLLGKNLLNDEIDTRDIDELVALLWAALLTESPHLDGAIDQEGKPDEAAQAGIEVVAKWFTMDKLTEIGEAITAAFNQARPPKEESSTPAPEGEETKNE